MQINQHNYESFFLMYVDDELSLQQKEMVDLFVQQNPLLAAELELLKQTILMADDDIQFADKGKLMKQQKFVEEELLTFLDGEADAQLAKKIQKLMLHDDALKLQIDQLKKLYLMNEDQYTYPLKKDLYKHSSVRRIDWWKMAAAASLLICVSAWLFLNKNEEVLAPPTALADTTFQQQVASAAIEPDTTAVLLPEKNSIATTALLSTPERSKKKVITSNKHFVQPQKKTIVANNDVSKTEMKVIQPIDKIDDAIELSSAPIDLNNKKIPIKKPLLKLPVNHPELQVVLSDELEKEKKNSVLKEIGKKIGDRALDILSNGGDNIYVAGFAINIKK